MKKNRLDLGMEDNMKIGMDLACAKANNGLGIKPNPWVRNLIAAELNRLFGPSWVDLAYDEALTDDSK